MKRAICFIMSLFILCPFTVFAAEGDAQSLETSSVDEVIIGASPKLLTSASGGTGIIAEYGTNGALLSLAVSDTYQDGAYVFEDPVIPAYGSTVKGMVWDSLTGMEPGAVSGSISGAAPEPSLPAPAGAVLLAEPIPDMNSYIRLDESSNYIQSFEDFCDGELSLEPLSDPDTNQNYNFNGESDDISIIREYIDLICSEGMNLELKDSYYFAYKDESYFSYAIDYTGTAKVEGNNTMLYGDNNTICDISVWGLTDGSDLELTFYIPVSMDVIDLGYRTGASSRTDINPAGVSARAGLYRLSDGSFRTSDGRLETELGRAMILRDGTEINSEAEYRIYTDKKEELAVDNFYRTESMYFTVPYNALIEGDMYELSAIRRKSNYSPPTAYKLGTAFAFNHSGQWQYPLYEGSYYSDLTIRLMYYEKDAAAVFYIYAGFIAEPFEIEALCAVDLSDAVVENTSSGGGSSGGSSSSGTSCWSCGGSGTCSGCGGSGYIYRYGSGGTSIRSDCPDCYVRGKCRICGGDGVI